MYETYWLGTSSASRAFCSNCGCDIGYGDQIFLSDKTLTILCTTCPKKLLPNDEETVKEIESLMRIG